MKLLLILLAIVVGVGLFMIYRNFSVPANLGHKDGMLSALPSSPNAISSQTEQQEKRVESLPFVGDVEESRQRLVATLKSLGNIEIVADEGTYLHAIATTPTMRFRDDLEFLFDQASAVIHARSASRVGYSDGGLNRKRYDQLREIYLTE